MVIIDAHSDYALKVYHEQLQGKKNILRELHLPRLKKGGVKLEVLTVGGDFDLYPEINARDPLTILKIINSIYNEINENAEIFTLITRLSDLDEILAGNKIGFVLSLEGAGSIDRDFTLLRNYYRLGIRSVGITHNERNIFADGCAEKSSGGLSALGENLIRELDALNILIDLSHISEKSFWDVLEITERPFITSHSNARPLCDHHRNLTDEQIKAIAQQKGLIGINFFGPFIDKKIENFTIDRLIDHIDYISNLVGINHICLGPDFLDYALEYTQHISRKSSVDLGFSNQMVKYPVGLENVTCLPNLIEILNKRGYSKQDINKIKCDNLIRLYNNIFK